MTTALREQLNLSEIDPDQSTSKLRVLIEQAGVFVPEDWNAVIDLFESCRADVYAADPIVDRGSHRNAIEILRRNQRDPAHAIVMTDDQLRLIKGIGPDRINALTAIFKTLNRPSQPRE